MTVFVFSNVPLDNRNGGGQRVLIKYLKELNVEKIVSIHLGYSDKVGEHGLSTVLYRQIPYRKFPFGLFSYRRAIKKVLEEFAGDSLFLYLPMDLQDVCLALAATKLTESDVIWVMDDFAQSRLSGVRQVLKSFVVRSAFRTLLKKTSRRIAISNMMKSNYEKKYSVPIHAVVANAWWSEAISKKPRALANSDGEIKIAWVGKFMPFYQSPLAALRKLLMKHPELPIAIDIYGQTVPSSELLLDGKINYRGSFSDQELPEILRNYNFGLLSYSFDKPSIQFMRYSLAGKLADYTSSALPVLAICPGQVQMSEELRKRQIGPVLNFEEEDLLKTALQFLSEITPEDYRRWSENALQWAQDSFSFEKNLAEFKKAVHFPRSEIR